MVPRPLDTEEGASESVELLALLPPISPYSLPSLSSALNLPTRLAVKNERFSRGRTAGYRAQVGHQDKPPYCSCLKRWCPGRGCQGELTPGRNWSRAPELWDTVLIQVASSEPHSIQVPNREKNTNLANMGVTSVCSCLLTALKMQSIMGH